MKLEDIAEKAGVSRSTVSRVVNNHPNVSQRTRDKVLQVVQENRFQPNTAARALASQRSQIITVILPHEVTDLFNDPFFPRILQSITSEANQLNYSVTLGLTSQEMSAGLFYDRLFNNQLTDGFIIISAVFDAALVEYLNGQEKPYLVIGKPDIRLNKAHSVDIDNTTGARQMVEHLISTGRRNIGFIPGRTGLSSANDRYLGYVAALENAGIDCDVALIGKPGMYTEFGGYQSMKELLNQSLDAVFCASDMMAVGAIQAINETGLSIPDDIAVAGFDDNTVLKVRPALTTVRQDIELLGKLAAQEFVSILNSEIDVIHQKTLPVELVIRESA